MEVLVLVLSVAFSACVFYVFGRRTGIEVERLRVESLCHQAILKRYSGSVKWVWNAVSSGQKELMAYEKFFVDDERSSRPGPERSP